MLQFLITFGAIIFLVLIMAVGVMFGRKPIVKHCDIFEALNVECASGCSSPCLRRRVINYLKNKTDNTNAKNSKQEIRKAENFN